MSDEVNEKADFHEYIVKKDRVFIKGGTIINLDGDY